MAYREGDAHSGDQSLEVLHIKFSDDYGATWTAEDTDLDGDPVSGFPKRQPEAGNEGPAEPWLYHAPNGNLILHHWRHEWRGDAYGTYQSVSSDGGLTWSASAAVTLVGYTGSNVIYSTDDHFVYDGVIYAAAREFRASDDEYRMIFVKSTDNGTTWDFVSNMTASFISPEAGIEYLGNNRIIAILRERSNSKTYKVTSDDMGATWSAVSDITVSIPASGRHRIMTRTHLEGGADWWEDNQLIMCGFVFVSAAIRRTCLWYSLDGGAEWSRPRWLDDSTQDAGYAHFFWDPTAEKVIVVSYFGTNAEADLKQYDVTVDWKDS